MEQVKPGTIKESLQYNSQDMDQEQEVNLNPKQYNKQDVRVFLVNEKADYSCKITGSVYERKTRSTIKGTEILLFFGYDSSMPVHKTTSDENGNFTIDDLPPGFYSIMAVYGDLRSKLYYLKILPEQNAFQVILI
ncbi:MAG: carboxypeptidase regulatory-like domain-containing protein [Clostridiaceae bacterium]|nr:carboxypeptidase regulatory-like domain-containing protein [Clostridiaceae bacterium]